MVNSYRVCLLAILVINQLYQAEKEIQCIGLLKQDALHRISEFTFHDVSDVAPASSLEGVWLYELFLAFSADNMTNCDKRVTYCVSGYTKVVPFLVKENAYHAQICW